MQVREELTVGEYYTKWQEEVDQITNARGLGKITVVQLPENSLRDGNYAGARRGEPSCAPILIEARDKVNEKYRLEPGP